MRQKLIELVIITDVSWCWIRESLQIYKTNLQNEDEIVLYWFITEDRRYHESISKDILEKIY